MTEPKREFVLHECPAISWEADPVAAELAALRAEIAALKEQIKTNNDDASRIISDLRAALTSIRTTARTVVRDNGQNHLKLLIIGDTANEALTGGKEARDAD